MMLEPRFKISTYVEWYRRYLLFCPLPNIVLDPCLTSVPDSRDRGCGGMSTSVVSRRPRVTRHATSVCATSGGLHSMWQPAWLAATMPRHMTIARIAGLCLMHHIMILTCVCITSDSNDTNPSQV